MVKKNYSPQEIADRVKKPRERKEEYLDRASLQDLDAFTYRGSPIEGDYEKARKHRKKAEAYRLISRKAKSDPANWRDISRLLDEYKIFLLIGIFVISLIFLSPNFTGNTIGNITNSTSNFIGVGLLVVGLIAGCLFFKNRKF